LTLLFASDRELFGVPARPFSRDIARAVSRPTLGMDPEAPVRGPPEWPSVLTRDAATRI
jgi:hypothetical protein